MVVPSSGAATTHLDEGSLPWRSEEGRNISLRLTFYFYLRNQERARSVTHDSIGFCSFFFLSGQNIEAASVSLKWYGILC